jgi:hypothetical protein
VFVVATVDAVRVDGRRAADHDDPSTAAVGVEVQADLRMTLDVSDLRRGGHRVDEQRPSK